MKFRYAVLALFSLFGTTTNVLAQNTILAELFRNTNCLNCRTPDDQFESYLAAHPEYKVEQIFFHNDITNPKDPFYLASKASVDQRSQKFYGVGTDPNAFIDGAGAGNSSGSWQTFVKAAASQTLPAQVTATSTFADGKILVNYTVSGSTGQNVKVFVLLKESGIVYVNPDLYGRLPNDTWNDVFRQTLPDITGTGQFTLNGTSSGTVTYDQTANPSWVVNNMRAVVVVQTLGNDPNLPHAVLGFTAIDLRPTAGIDTKSAVSHPFLSVIGNPVSNGSAFRISLPQSARVRVVLNDMLGREAGALGSVVLSQGESSLEFGSLRLAPGTYIARMFVDGVEADHVKVVYQP